MSYRAFPFCHGMAAILVHNLSLCTKMTVMAVAKLLLCCDIMIIMWSRWLTKLAWGVDKHTLQAMCLDSMTSVCRWPLICTMDTEVCKLVVTCKMQNRNATDKLNQQCSKLVANTINNANLLHCGFSLSVAFLFCILQVTTNLQSLICTHTGVGGASPVPTPPPSPDMKCWLESIMDNDCACMPISC